MCEQAAVENIEEEPTVSQQMNASALVKLYKEQKVLWAMEDLLIATDHHSKYLFLCECVESYITCTVMQ